MTEPHTEGDQAGWQKHAAAPPEETGPTRLSPVGWGARAFTYGVALIVLADNIVDNIDALRSAITVKKVFDAAFVILLFGIVLNALFRPSVSARGRWNKWGWLLIAVVALGFIIYGVNVIRDWRAPT